MEKFKEGEIEKSAALTLARLPEKMQKEVIEQGITKNVDMIQLTDAMINVFHTILGKLNTEKSVNNFI